MRRFWTMLAHWHGQTWNASGLGRAITASDKTVRHYLDLLTGACMVRQLQPWFENVARRQVKAPKVYFRDTGILHALLELPDEAALLGHPRAGASWEGFAIEQVLRALGHPSAWFWAAHGGGELDLLVVRRGRRIGFEVKFNEAPQVTRGMRAVAKTLAQFGHNAADKWLKSVVKKHNDATRTRATCGAGDSPLPCGNW